MDFCFERLLEAAWPHLERLLGCLGGLLGGPVFQKPGGKQVQMHVCEIVRYRYLSSLGALSSTILAHFGWFWNPKLKIH